MELQQLHYFKTAAEMQNITQAAKKLYISQPALSASIGRLERDIGVRLFERHSNSIRLTEAGNCFLEHVNSAFAVLGEGVSKAKAIENRKSNRVRVASALGMVRSLAEEYAGAGYENPVSVTTCDVDQICSMLVNGEADFGICLEHIQDSRFSNRVLMWSRYFVALHPKHPLARKKTVKLKDLEGIFLFCSNIARTYETAQTILQKGGCKCTLLKLDEKEVLFEAAKKGLGGVFCIPMLSKNNPLTNLADPGIVFRPIEDCLDRGCVVLVCLKEGYLSEMAEDFITFLSRRFYLIEESTEMALREYGLHP